MPLSAIDPTAALIIVDFQKGVTGRSGIQPVLDRSAALADEFRRQGLPVVLVTVDGSAPGRTDTRRGATAPRALRAADWAEPATELGARNTDIRITKQRWGMFTGTDLHRILREHGVTQVVITGIATSLARAPPPPTFSPPCGPVRRTPGAEHSRGPAGRNPDRNLGREPGAGSLSAGTGRPGAAEGSPSSTRVPYLAHYVKLVLALC